MAEAEKQQPDPLCTFELRLLRCTLPPDSPIQTPPSSSQPNPSTNLLHFHSLIHELLQSIESGHYVGALSSDAARAVFVFGPQFYDDSADCAARFYSELVPNRIKSFILGANSEDECELRYRLFLVMAIGVAALLAFTQCNITGPVERLPIIPLIGLLNKEEGGGDGGWMEWEGWARKEITSSVGSDLLGKFSNLQYIVVAKILLISSKDLLLEAHISSLDGIATISWWLVRLLLLQQRLLHDRSSCLFDLLQVVMRESLHHFGSFEKVTSYWGVSLLTEEALAIVSMLHVEAGIMEYIYARIDSSRIHFQSAEVASGLCLSVSGALGFRTVHQVEPKAQLVLLASTNSDDKGNSISAELTRKLSTVSEDNLQQHSHNYNEVSDVLMAPRLLDDYSDSANGAKVIQSGSSGVKQLKAVQQAVILAHCLLIEKSARQDELQRWKMAPYIEAIDSQNSSHHIIQIFCDILRIRWESTRSRTKERALLMMNKVVEVINESCPRVAERIFYCYGANLPTISALRKEYGDLLVSCRMLGEAAKVYEDLELWDNLIYCYQLMEKKAAAVELIKMRLSESPDDPRLWCSLGDVTNNDTCYEKALEVSENKSTRAKRSLARSAYSRGDYEKSKILWESAMALNSLYPDGWFAFGAAALKARDLEKALDAFTHAVQLDPENGEAWNNLACLHMIKKRNKEAFIAFKEALKFKRYSWQMWENFGHVAADIGNFDQAIEALQSVLDISNNKRIDVGLLERVMREIEGKTLSSHSQSSTGDDHDSADISHADADIICGNGSRNSEQGLAKSRDTEHLMELLGKILQRIVKSDTRPEMWGLYATWHKLKGDLTMCSEALLKQVRSYQGSDLWKDRDRFKKFAHASVELCKVYMELANHNTSRRELLAAEMLLKNTIKQAGNFSETEEFANLQNSLDMVKMKLQASSVCAA